MEQTVTVTNYYIEWYDYEDDTKFLTFCESEAELFYKASKLYAFDDCAPITIKTIVCNGVDCKYVGWQPGMVYEFYDCETKEIIYHGEFPEWDH